MSRISEFKRKHQEKREQDRAEFEIALTKAKSKHALASQERRALKQQAKADWKATPKREKAKVLAKLAGTGLSKIAEANAPRKTTIRKKTRKRKPQQQILYVVQKAPKRRKTTRRKKARKRKPQKKEQTIAPIKWF